MKEKEIVNYLLKYVDDYYVTVAWGDDMKDLKFDKMFRPYFDGINPTQELVDIINEFTPYTYDCMDYADGELCLCLNLKAA